MFDTPFLLVFLMNGVDDLVQEERRLPVDGVPGEGNEVSNSPITPRRSLMELF